MALVDEPTTPQKLAVSLYPFNKPSFLELPCPTIPHKPLETHKKRIEARPEAHAERSRSVSLKSGIQS